MKKIMLLLGLMMLMLILNACTQTQNTTSSTDTAEKQQDNATPENSGTDISEDTSNNTDSESDSTTTTEVPDVDQTSESDTASSTADPAPEVSIDISKTDLALLASIPLRIPESLIYVTESVSDDGSKTISTTYTKGDFSRNEYVNETDGMTQISIDNPELGANYMFILGQSSGILSKDMDYEDKGTASDPDYETATYADLFLQEEFPDLKASVEDLDGHQTIHIISSQSDEDSGTMEINMWYSTEFAIPLRYDMTVNGVLISNSVVTDYQVNVEIDDDLFIPPTDVEFVEW